MNERSNNMYGTVARLRVKPGAEQEIGQQLHEFAAARVPGFVTTYIYRMDADPSTHFMAVVFDSREAYEANANSKEQDARYRKLRELLGGDPEWHDGEIVAVIRG